MTLTPVKTPLVVKKMFPNYVWDIATNDNVIYLTFDDGPTPEITTWTLDTLKAFNAKATFFCIGNNIEKHPEIFQHILDEGHAIGNHTNNHIKGWKTKAKDYLENVSLCESVFKNKIPHSGTGNSPSPIVNLFRPPYGQITPKQGKKLLGLGYKIIMWDILSFDWEKDIPKETCLKNVLSKTTNGSIVVFHDSVKASKNMQYVLPKVLKYYSKKGFSFKALEF
ncbi:polysaccharide deacetylase family protein [Mariniflexile sp. AS56]|uniref:polysaccharide deacetylase family protein n=1 Tax=Mariniflexile sp. AS56 TaxID=3063957 RepID=UPI0026EC178B|nr:polysaccharide deacetylase family protein [Mariniflexile sp. AS56]MDO7173409.1 polysaccharide deacetylase family protein [Mariniflexile sp. AS56]